MPRRREQREEPSSRVAEVAGSPSIISLLGTLQRPRRPFRSPVRIASHGREQQGRLPPMLLLFHCLGVIHEDL